MSPVNMTSDPVVVYVIVALIAAAALLSAVFALPAVSGVPHRRDEPRGPWSTSPTSSAYGEVDPARMKGRR